MLRFKVAERIAEKEFREKSRIKVMDISEATGINRMTLSKLLNHHDVNIQTDILDRLCRYFKCQVSDLVEYIDED